MGDGKARRAAGRHGEGGFTLAQLLVGLVIAGVLLAIVVPTFLRTKGGTSDAAARTRTRQALLTQKMYYTDRGLWGKASEIQTLEPSVKFDDLDSGGPQVLGKVYVKVDGGVATLVTRSATGTCYWARQSASGTAYATLPCEDTPVDADFTNSW